MLEKIKNLNEIKLFITFLIIIFASRSLYLVFSLSNFPWFYEWEAMRYLTDFKNGDMSFSSFIFLYEIKNQFQLFTKILYLALFSINNFVWSPKFFTIIVQLIPSIYIAIIIKNLFKDNLNSYLLLFFLVIFSIFPASLANFYHFSETHFYFHILISVLSFEVFTKFENKKIRFLLIIFLFCCAALNMEFVALTLYLTFSTFFLVKFLEMKDKNFFYLFLLSLIFAALYYKGLYFFEIPSINDASQLAEKKIGRSIYLVFKGFFHQNSLLIGLFIIFGITKYKKLYADINENKNKNFIILILIFFFVFIGSVAISRVQIYDRYRDLIQIGGLISLFLYSKLLIESKFSKLFLTTITLIVIAYNSLFFLDKFYERRKESIKYDYLLSKSISSFILYNKEIKKNDLDKNGKKYIDQIMISVSNKIINIQ